MAPVKNSKIVRGRWGEAIALDYLLQKGYKFIDRNARNRYGELDLVVENDGLIIFVEVKTRFSTSFGLPEVSVSERKQNHLIQAAQSYIQDHPEIGDHWRIDVISIMKKATDKTSEILHFEDAVH